MNKTLLAVLLALASPSLVAAESGNGRISGKAGAAWATGDFIDGALLNPSLAANFKATDNFALNINAGAFATDPNDLINKVDDLSDLLDRYDHYRHYGDQPPYETLLDPADAEAIIGLLRDVDGGTVYLEGGASVAIAIPNNTLAITAFGRACVSASATPNVSQDDLELLGNSVNSPFLSDQLDSSALAVGALITEYGVALAKRIDWTEQGDLLVGVTPKMVEVETFYYHESVNDFDADDLKDNHKDYSRSSDFFGLDAGATYIQGSLNYAFVVNNLIRKTVDTVVTGEQLAIKPHAVSAVGYDIGWFNAEAALDVTANKSFALTDSVQLLRAGIELGANQWAQLRLGYKTDLKGNLEDSYSVGFGLSPFNVINLDIALSTGSKNTYGGALQLGMRF